MNIAQSLRDAAAALSATSDTPRLDAELLMANALGISRSELLLRHMEAAVPDAFQPLIARRLNYEPVAYILGIHEFHGLEFLVNSDVLIPRGDSEVLVEVALAAMRNDGAAAGPGARTVLDCGTGSGALLLAVLAGLPEAQGVGIDRSLGALTVAAANAARLGLTARARLLRADWDAPGWADALGQFDLIIANPPYVEAGAQLSPSVRSYEPAGALFAGSQGLDAYRMLVPQLPDLLTANGVALLEIGSTQTEAVSKIAQASGFAVTLHHDLAGRPRVLEIKFSLGLSPTSA